VLRLGDLERADRELVAVELAFGRDRQVVFLSGRLKGLDRELIAFGVELDDLAVLYSA